MKTIIRMKPASLCLLLACTSPLHAADNTPATGGDDATDAAVQCVTGALNDAKALGKCITDAANKAVADAAARGDAKATSSKAESMLKDWASQDYSVPDVPAAALLGTPAAAIARPQTIRAASASLLSLANSDGHVKNGVGVAISPVALFSPQFIRGGDDYKDHRSWKQPLAYATLSAATADVAGTAGASQMAWGFRTAVFDLGDPGLYYKESGACFDRLMSGTTVKPGMNLDGPPASGAGDVNDCDPGKLIRNLWAKPSLYTGFGQSWFSADGTLQNHSPATAAIWLTGSIGLNPDKAPKELPWLLQIHAEGKNNDRVADKNNAGSFVSEDSSSLLARLRTGQDKWHSYAEAGVSRVQTAGVLTTNVRHVGIGLEFEVQDNVWIVTGLVNQHGYQDQSDSTLFNTSIRLGTKPVYLVGGDDAKAQ